MKTLALFGYGLLLAFALWGLFLLLPGCSGESKQDANTLVDAGGGMGGSSTDGSAVATGGSPDGGGMDVLSDLVSETATMSTQIFPGLCCGQPGVECQNTLTMGACCPSAMSTAGCQAMWGAETWCYCPTGFDCLYQPIGVSVPPDQNWACIHT